MTTVGFFYPGAMGATVAAACRGTRLWVADGRSPLTIERAEGAGLERAGDVDEIVERCDVVVSVCPPGLAVQTADLVATHGFEGTYIDANAIAPSTAREIATRFSNFVDAGIIGPPASRAGTTRMYVAGDNASDMADLWAGSVLDVRVVEGGAGSASALKLAYATWTKVSAALLLSVRGFARSEGVESDLVAEWDLSQPGLAERSEATASGTAPKGWRFDAEMDEIAKAFADRGFPEGFGASASDVFRRMAGFKGRSEVGLDEVVECLLRGSPESGQ